MTNERTSSGSSATASVRPLWQRCEQTFETWLKSQGYGVTPLAGAVGNTAGTDAPMLSHGARKYRAPDFDSVKGGLREFWEVKYRSRPFVDPVTGHAEHRVDRECFDDYAAVQQIWQTRVWIIVYEAATASTPARWLRIRLDDAARTGRSGLCPTADDQMVESQLWPVEEMEVLIYPAHRRGGWDSADCFGRRADPTDFTETVQPVRAPTPRTCSARSERRHECPAGD